MAVNARKILRAYNDAVTAADSHFFTQFDGTDLDDLAAQACAEALLHRL